MDNRRQDYRHALLPQLHLPVEVLCAAAASPVVGVIVNLSVGGMAVQVACEELHLAAGEPCEVRFAVPEKQQNMTVQALVVHQSSTGDYQTYGLHFLPLANAETTENRETAIWRFLLDDQRQQRRRLVEKNRDEIARVAPLLASGHYASPEAAQQTANAMIQAME
jgi:hypothetical protein